MKLPHTSPERAKDFFQNKIDFTTGPVEVQHMLQEASDEVNIVDVRAAKDYAMEHLPSAVNLPQQEWSSLRGLSHDKLNIVYCYSMVCHLAAKAALNFAAHGYRVMEMEGGMKEWKMHRLPVDTGEQNRMDADAGAAADQKAG